MGVVEKKNFTDVECWISSFSSSSSASSSSSSSFVLLFLFFLLLLLLLFSLLLRTSVWSFTLKVSIAPMSVECLFSVSLLSEWFDWHPRLRQGKAVQVDSFKTRGESAHGFTAWNYNIIKPLLIVAYSFNMRRYIKERQLAAEVLECVMVRRCRLMTTLREKRLEHSAWN
jgi:hypothetical protein